MEIRHLRYFVAIAEQAFGDLIKLKLQPAASAKALGEFQSFGHAKRGSANAQSPKRLYD